MGDVRRPAVNMPSRNSRPRSCHARTDDAMIARLEAEIEERNALIEGCIAAAQDGSRDLNTPGDGDDRRCARAHRRGASPSSTRCGRRRRSRSSPANGPSSSPPNSTRPAPVAGHPTNVEYRSAGQYVADRYMAQMGDEGALTRMEVFHRAAAHQTTADNPGLLPENIVAPIVNFVDTSRPIVSVIGPQDLGTGSWSYARITQHTQVGVQSAEKTELASRKMLITKTPLAAPTYGGYVNVSRQDINRTSPQILDMVIADLAGQYAIQTEAAAATDLTAAATAGPVIPATPTAANIATAIYAAAGSVFTATQGQGRTVIALSPDQLGIIAPLFPGVNPQNA